MSREEHIATAESIRNRYRMELEDAIAERDGLNLKIEYKKGRLEVAEEILEELKGGKQDHTLPLAGTGIYSDVGLTVAITDILKQSKDKQGLLTLEIMDSLMKGGFTYKGTALYNTVYSVARSLAKQGIAVELKKNGKRSFAAK